MKKTIFEICSNIKIADDIFEMVLVGNTDNMNPGQFVNILIDGLYLRRPISVCDCEDDRLTLVYKVVGKGTEKMSMMKIGERLELLTSLGNGFDAEKSGEKAMLIGGGVGVPPMYYLAKRLISQGKKVVAVLGFNTSSQAFFIEKFRLLGAEVYVTTADGSLGIKGFVTDATKLVNDATYFYACGPEPMLKAVYDNVETDGQMSFEERMGCGFGACMGCSCKTKYGNKRICKDGPVLEKGEIIW